MREIKFRAWDKDKGMSGGFSLFEIGDDNGRQYVGGYGRIYESTTIMQFTGLLDKNGKEIYEGDIVYLAGYGDYQVEFPFIQLYEAVQENDIGGIIGNIYSNPELLSEQTVK